MKRRGLLSCRKSQNRQNRQNRLRKARERGLDPMARARRVVFISFHKGKTASTVFTFSEDLK